MPVLSPAAKESSLSDNKKIETKIESKEKHLWEPWRLKGEGRGRGQRL
jgi:hypothetical protein